MKLSHIFFTSCGRFFFCQIFGAGAGAVRMRVRSKSKRSTCTCNMTTVTAAVCIRFGACAVAGCGNISEHAVWYVQFMVFTIKTCL